MDVEKYIAERKNIWTTHILQANTKFFLLYRLHPNPFNIPTARRQKKNLAKETDL